MFKIGWQRKMGGVGGWVFSRLEIIRQNNMRFYLISEGDLNIVRYKSFIRLITHRAYHSGMVGD